MCCRELLCFNCVAVKKRIELVEKYRQLKKKGNFAKYMEKKRGRTARRDHVKLPFRRWSNFEI